MDATRVWSRSSTPSASSMGPPHERARPRLGPPTFAWASCRTPPPPCWAWTVPCMICPPRRPCSTVGTPRRDPQGHTNSVANEHLAAFVPMQEPRPCGRTRINRFSCPARKRGRKPRGAWPRGFQAPTPQRGQDHFRPASVSNRWNPSASNASHLGSVVAAVRRGPPRLKRAHEGPAPRTSRVPNLAWGHLESCAERLWSWKDSNPWMPAGLPCVRIRTGWSQAAFDPVPTLGLQGHFGAVFGDEVDVEAPLNGR